MSKFCVRNVAEEKRGVNLRTLGSQPDNIEFGSASTIIKRYEHHLSYDVH